MDPTLAQLLWDARGRRRLPRAAELDQALTALPRGRLQELAELNPIAPLYLIPTKAFLRALGRRIRACGATRVLEVAAGDGHLGRSLAKVAPELRITMSDSGAWEKPRARMNAREKERFRQRAVAGIALPADVERLEARAAIARHKPELVLASWLPPGPALERIIKSKVEYVLEIGAGSGVTGDISCWRFPHEFCDGPLEDLARCRLDERPRKKLHTRVTLYLGAAHPDFYEEKNHWLGGKAR